MSNLLNVSSQLDQFLRELMNLIPEFYTNGFGKNFVDLVPGRSESEDIQVPTWCGQEITGIKSLSNASLAKTPISKLSLKDRMKAAEE